MIMLVGGVMVVREAVTVVLVVLSLTDGQKDLPELMITC